MKVGGDTKMWKNGKWVLKYYVLIRTPYSDEIEFKWFEADDKGLEDFYEKLDEPPALGTTTVLSEEEYEDLKKKMENPEKWETN